MCTSYFKFVVTSYNCCSCYYKNSYYCSCYTSEEEHTFIWNSYSWSWICLINTWSIYTAVKKSTNEWLTPIRLPANYLIVYLKMQNCSKNAWVLYDSSPIGPSTFRNDPSKSYETEHEYTVCICLMHCSELNYVLLRSKNHTIIMLFQVKNKLLQYIAANYKNFSYGS